MASSNRLDQRGSTKLARHQQSLLLRVQLVGEQKAIAIRPWSHTSAPTVHRIAIYLESNVKWQNTTKDYIISIISSGHRCAAVDLGISILFLPPAILHNKADNSPLGNQQSGPKEWNCQRFLETVDFNHERRDGQLCLLLDGLSDAMAISKPRKCPPAKTSWTTWRTSSEYCASLRSSTSFENQSRPKQSERKRLETSSILFYGQKLRSRTSATLSLMLNGAVSASLISPWSFGLFGNAGATSNINSCWKHPI